MKSKVSKLKRVLPDDSDSVQTNDSPSKKRKVDESAKTPDRIQSSLPLKKRLTSVFEKENKSTYESRSPTKQKNPEKVLKNSNQVDDDDFDDEIFSALKKSGIRADRSRHKSPKSSPDQKPLKKVTELEKSPDSLILNHKRTPKKKVDDDFESSLRCSPRKSVKVETPKKITKEYETTPVTIKKTPKINDKEKNVICTPRSTRRSIADDCMEWETTPVAKSSKKTPRKSDTEKYELCTPKSTRRSSIIEVTTLDSPLTLKISRRSSRYKKEETPEPEERRKSSWRIKRVETPEPEERKKSSKIKREETPEPEERKKSSRIKREETPEPEERKKSSRIKRGETPEPEERKKSSSKKSSSKKKEKYEPVTPSTRRIIAEQPRTPLEKARQSLHVSTIPEAMPCREKEFKNVLMFLENKLQDGIGGCMYISGVPGTGKTATVTQVIRHLRELVNEGTIPDFKFIEINGMRLADPRQAYVQICQQLFGNKDKLAPDKALQKLDAWFSKNDRKNSKVNTVLLVDELDLICTKKQEVIYNILDWPTRIHSRLIVLTIANTMDMPERLFKGRVTSRLGLTRLTFMPYTHKQLEEIVLARLSGLNAFSHDAVQLVTRKVAAVSGDARRALDICRRATELPAPDETVTIKHIDKAIREMTHSNIARVIRSCSDLEKLFLKSMSDISVHSGLEEVEFLRVIDQFFAACALEGTKKPPVSSVISLSNRLKCFRLIYTNQSSGGILQKLTLNVTRDDIYYALNDKVNSSEF